MACQYPIYISNNSDVRNSKSGCGGRQWLSTTIFVGSSSHYNEQIGELEIHRLNNTDINNIVEFQVLFNEKILKRMYFNTKTKQFYKRRPKDVTK